MDQVKTDKMVKSAKNLRPKNAIKHVKMTQEDFAVNNCAQITDPEELKKQIQQLVHVNKIKNFVQRVNNLKQIKYLNKVRGLWNDNKHGTQIFLNLSLFWSFLLLVSAPKGTRWNQRHPCKEIQTN